MHHSPLLPLVASIILCTSIAAQVAEPWKTAYTGDDATGAHVIAYWNFDDTNQSVNDVSGHGHEGTLAGATRRTDGHSGACIESFPGWPVEDVRHAVAVPDAPDLSPPGAFTIEMWLRPNELPDGYAEMFLLDKKYVAHTDYQWILQPPNKLGQHYMRVVLGFGEDSDTWWSSDPASLQHGVWTHLAITYDGAGTVRFFQDGRSLGQQTRPGRGSIAAGDHALSIGDRVGSLHHGFPGSIDDVRITTGAREFRPLTVTAEHIRTAYERMEPAPLLKFRLTNITRETIPNLNAEVGIAGVATSSYPIAELAPGASQTLEYSFDTSLRPDTYAVTVDVEFPSDDTAYANHERFPLNLVPRKPPHRMPVVLWDIGGVEGVINETPRIKDIGFTHCLGLRCDYQSVWDAGGPVPPVNDAELASYKMLDHALVNDLGIVISLSPASFLEQKPELRRIDATGNPYETPNLCASFPEAAALARNVGASVAQSYGAFPAWDAALIHTEIRDATQLCFHDHDRARYTAATGKPYPEHVGSKGGVSFQDIAGFPGDRVIPDDNELLTFYRWFWREGDGWNDLHSAVNDGIKSTSRSDLWTFFDPAVRVPPLWGSGGNVDFVSHWTYSYPDPIRIGLTADELFAMAKGGPEGQQVMKMTQIIWYRSETAPTADPAAPASAKSPWEDRDPEAAYITIAPMHLREAFWTKIARPVRGIMYHGWNSLVPNDGHSAYRYTHPETRHALKALLHDVIEPLGPTLLQVPAAPADVAFLESFSSVMFAGRGTYGWGGSWAGDAYHILQYAHLQPEIVYEESVLEFGLDNYKVLVLADCDVLPASIVQKILEFQRGGGVIIGDERLCPATTPDILLPVYARTKQADADKAALIERARDLANQLTGRYSKYVASSVPDVLPYRRQFGTSDYIFAINDCREFGNYVGFHHLVMEQGVNADAEFTVNREAGFVYDLLDHRRVDTTSADGTMRWPVQLEPGDGRIFLITDRPVERLTIQAPTEATRSREGERTREPQYTIHIAITDTAANPVDAVIPLDIRITDPDGRPGEFSGYYGAPGGSLDLALDFASNDTPGTWTIQATELATNLRTRHFIRLHHNDET